MLEESRRTGVSLRQLIDSKRGDPSVGASRDNARTWMIKDHAMYCQRRSLCFRGVNHLSLVADPSTHSKGEVMIGVFYSWEAGLAAFFNSCSASLGGFLLQLGFQNLGPASEWGPFHKNLIGVYVGYPFGKAFRY